MYKKYNLSPLEKTLIDQKDAKDLASSSTWKMKETFP